MAAKIRTFLGLVFSLALVFNLAGCAQTGPPPSSAATQAGAYQQEQKMLWNTAPQGSGQSTDWGLYMDEQGAM